MATTVKQGQMFIGGEWVDSSAGETATSSVPPPARSSPRSQEGTAEDADRAVAAAKKAFDEVWFDTTPKERSPMLLKLADAIEANAEEFVRIESENVGQAVAVDDVRGDPVHRRQPPVLRRRRAGAGGPAPASTWRGFTSLVRREPIGVAGLIAPWNYPLMMAIWKIGPALAAGQHVVLKPSELTPLTALRMAELAADIFPPGVFNVITGRRRARGRRPGAHPDVRHRLAHRRHRHRQAHRRRTRPTP